jgi:hypothetical protein
MLPSGIALHDEGCKQACSSGSRCIFRGESSILLPCLQKGNFISKVQARRSVAGSEAEVVYRELQWASSLAGKQVIDKNGLERRLLHQVA